ncbi:MAG: hypothetical protein KGN84_03335 [Acidobacteriota bacterium]|nr:hypothetical protein [Acidobacteriota bacterium]
MVVKIRFGRGPIVTRKKGKNGRIAMLAGSFLTLISTCLFSLGIWRLLEDFDMAGNFIYSDGLLSHWQVWIASAAVLQYSSWRLSRYARAAREEEPAAAEPEKETPPQMAANV